MFRQIQVFEGSESNKRNKSAQEEIFPSIKKLKALNASLALTTLNCSFIFFCANFLLQIFD